MTPEELSDLNLSKEILTEENAHEVSLLFTEVFKRSLLVKDLHAKYCKTNMPFDPFGLLIRHKDGRVVAFMGVIPSVLDYEGEEITVAQACDGVTYQPYRMKGLYSALAETGHNIAYEKGAKLFFGFPNSKSLPGLKHKMKWNFNDKMQKFEFAIRTIPLCEISYKITFLKPLYRMFVNWFLRSYKIDPTTEAIKSLNYKNVKGHMKKDLPLLHYKLNKPDNYLINYKGFILMVQYGVHLKIAEAGYFPEEKINEFISAIKLIARNTGSIKVTLILNRYHWLYQYLQKVVLSTDSLDFGYLFKFKELDETQIQLSFAEFDTF